MAFKRGLVSDEGNENTQHQATQQNQPTKFPKCLCKDEIWLKKYSAQLENVFRKVVREEAEQAILRSVPSISRSLQNQDELSDSRKFKLHFEGSLPGRLYTGNRVEAEGLSPIKVVLLDSLSGHIVTDGSLSSLKVETVVLYGHFKAEQLDDWKQKDFNDNIVPAREGKRPLLVGEHVIALRNGVGFVGGICFTDNSSWVRSKMFRLGARVYLAKEDQVKEAVSSPFEVKDRRGETYQKRDTPSLEDEVWRLHGIAKDGTICKRLAEHQIFKVKDLLQLYYTDEVLLRDILGVSAKKWEAIVQQAILCSSSNVFTSPVDISTVSMSLNTISSLPLQCACVPAASEDQPELPMSYYNGTDHNHQLDQAVLIGDNSLMADSLAGSYDDGQNSFQGYPTAPSSAAFPLHGQNLFHVPTSNWFSTAQPMGEEGNVPFVGSSTISDIGTLPSFPNMGPSTLDIAEPKPGWNKIRAV